MEELEGSVSHIVFRSEDSGYTVFTIEDKGEEVTCVGNFSGKQFFIERFELLPPDTLTGIEQYLASGAVKGIGKTIAKRIVKEFKEDSLRIMEEEPERLAEVRGISERMARDIAHELVGKKDRQDAVFFLQGLGIGPQLSYKIYQHFQGEIYTILRENP